jgi:hypothetical protein
VRIPLDFNFVDAWLLFRIILLFPFRQGPVVSIANNPTSTQEMLRLLNCWGQSDLVR